MIKINVWDSYPVKRLKEIDNRIEELETEIAHLSRRLRRMNNHYCDMLPDIDVIQEMLLSGNGVNFDTPETLKLEKRMETLTAIIDILWKEYKIWKPNASFMDVNGGMFNEKILV